MTSWVPLNGYKFNARPRALSEIIPFSHNEGRTYQEALERIYEFIMYELIPYINRNTQEWNDDTERAIKALEDAVTNARNSAADAASDRTDVAEMKNAVTLLKAAIEADKEKVKIDRALYRQENHSNLTTVRREYQQHLENMDEKVQQVQQLIQVVEATVNGITVDDVITNLASTNSQFNNYIRDRIGLPVDWARRLFQEVEPMDVVKDYVPIRFGKAPYVHYYNVLMEVPSTSTLFRTAVLSRRYANLDELISLVNQQSINNAVRHVIVSDLGVGIFHSAGPEKVGQLTSNLRGKFPNAQVYIMPYVSGKPLHESSLYTAEWPRLLRNTIYNIQTNGGTVIPGWNLLPGRLVSAYSRTVEEKQAIEENMRRWILNPQPIHFPSLPITRKMPAVNVSGYIGSSLASYQALTTTRVDDRVRILGGYTVTANINAHETIATIQEQHCPLGRVIVNGWSAKKGNVTFAILGDGTIRPEFAHATGEQVTITGDWSVI